LFQMIGKNAGIRRASGKLILATNIDILFDEPVLWYLLNRVKHDVVLRADRFDVSSTILSEPACNSLEFASKNVTAIFTRFGVLATHLNQLFNFSSFNILTRCWEHPDIGPAFCEAYLDSKGSLGLSPLMRSLRPEQWERVTRELAGNSNYLHTQ